MANHQNIQQEISKLIKAYEDNAKTAQAPIETGTTSSRENIKKEIKFNILPTELESYLREYVIDQESAIETIATKICTHFKRMHYEKQNFLDESEIIGNIKSNIILVGPTGVGKTYIIKLIADYIGVPFVKADATKFSETGYVGGDVEDLVRELVRKADGQIETAEYGIIYIDEIDKIASSNNTNNPDISRSGVQRNLLKIMEDSDVDIKSPFDISSQMEIILEAQQQKTVKKKQINTKNILFIVSGAFGGIADIIKKRLNLRNIGFNSQEIKKRNLNDNKILKHINQEDLINFGFEAEFVGRLPIIAVLHELDVQGLYKILKNPKASVILSKQRDFKSYGINLAFNDSALLDIAKLASSEKTGARSLLSIIEKKLIKFEKTMPSTDIKNITVTKELVDNPNKVLDNMLLKDAIDRIVKHFKEKYSINLVFNPNTFDKINSLAKKNNLNYYDYCAKTLEDYKYGLKLLEKQNFEVTEEVFDNHKEYLDKFIKKAYEKRKPTS